jgi:hypothetical protein
MDTVQIWLHWIADFFTILNPVMFFVATLMWVILHHKTIKQLDRSYMRCYSLEKQIDYLINKQNYDPEYVALLRKMYQEF